MHNFPHWDLEPATLFTQGPIIPVITIDELAQALPLAKALIQAKINVLEITLRTPIALDAIHILRQELPETIIGAGTVINPYQLDACIRAGAAFAVSPGLSQNLLKASIKGPIPLVPGVSSVSEIIQGLELGFNYFKFFPAEAAGGIKMLQAIHGPLPQVTFCATGGINEKNYLDYLALPNVACIGGSWILPSNLIKQACWQDITKLCVKTLAKAQPELL